MDDGASIPEAALQDIQEAFQISIDPTTDEAAFWTEARKAYEQRNWKGFTFNAIDPATLKVTDLL